MLRPAQHERVPSESAKSDFPVRLERMVFNLTSPCATVQLAKARRSGHPRPVGDQSSTSAAPMASTPAATKAGR